MTQRQDLVIRQGATFTMEIRWALDVVLFKAITGVTKAAPAVITCPNHGIPDGWPLSVRDVVGMEEINNPGGEYTADVIDVNTLQLVGESSLRFADYVSGGVLEYLEPMSLASAIARMKVKQTKSSTSALISLDSALIGGIGLDDTSKIITVTLTPAQTAVLSFKQAYYDLEVQLPSTDVERLIEGVVTLSEEVTD